ncbi:polysaccharide deacetylase family protein [bacterium]|nr:polysaccharide deacetylase family protein [bacterium]
MIIMKVPSFIFVVTAVFIWAEPEGAVIDLTPQLEEVEDDGSRVSVLGYHEFHATKPLTQMRIQTSKFRQQMEAIKASEIPVVTMENFLQWRHGERDLPPKSFLITIDDGWKSVYTEAYPVLKELKLPFTIFLYKNYVGSSRGGRAMSFGMINEMLESGLCTIGSHSVSHPFPGTVKKSRKAGPETFAKFLQTELGDSKSFLEENFKKPVTTYAYPGGYHTPQMFPLADELGYDNLFTVKPGKVARNSPRHILPRYIVLGNDNGAFNAAMVFRSGASLASGVAAPVVLPYPVSPRAGFIIASRVPRISAELNGVEGLDPDSVVMRVGGFGKVPAVLNAETNELSWTVNRALRQPICEVSVQWRLKGKESYEPVMSWSFGIDRVASYQSQ